MQIDALMRVKALTPAYTTQAPTKAFEEFDFSSASDAYVSTSEAASLTGRLATEVSCLDVANDEEWSEVDSEDAGDEVDDDAADGYESDPEYAPSSYFSSSGSSSSDDESSELQQASNAAPVGGEGTLGQQAGSQPQSDAGMTEADELLEGCGFSS